MILFRMDHSFLRFTFCEYQKTFQTFSLLVVKQSHHSYFPLLLTKIEIK